ncbi:MAG: YncE family protein [Terracidiphilus sp.]
MPFTQRTAFPLLLAVLALPGCHKNDFPEYTPDYREYAYVTNGGSNTVTIVDVVNVRIDRELTVGQTPIAVAVNPTRNEAYVVNQGPANGSGSVSVIDAQSNSVAATIPVRRLPVSIEVDPAGELAYVANSGSNSISVVNLKDRREVAVLGTGEEPASARIAPDGKTLVVANRKGDSVTLVDAVTRQVRSVFEGCPGASDVVILPDSSKALVACSAGHQVMVVTLVRAAQPATPAAPDRLEALLDVGQAPTHLTLKPDGGETFAMNSASNTVSELYNSTDEVGATYLIGDNPVRGVVSYDNQFLYVANQHSQYVNLYAIDDGRRAGSVHVGDGPSALAFSAAGHLLFVVDSGSGDVAVVRTSSRSLFTLLPAGRSPNAIAVKAFKLVQ